MIHILNNLDKRVFLNSTLTYPIFYKRSHNFYNLSNHFYSFIFIVVKFDKFQAIISNQHIIDQSYPILGTFLMKSNFYIYHKLLIIIFL